jgi:hypothetical protein
MRNQIIIAVVGGYWLTGVAAWLPPAVRTLRRGIKDPRSALRLNLFGVAFMATFLMFAAVVVAPLWPWLMTRAFPPRHHKTPA